VQSVAMNQMEHLKEEPRVAVLLALFAYRDRARDQRKGRDATCG
jgi:hypothetical protein